MFSGQHGFELSERQKKPNLSKFDREVVLAYEKCYAFTDGFFCLFHHISVLPPITLYSESSNLILYCTHSHIWAPEYVGTDPETENKFALSSASKHKLIKLRYLRCITVKNVNFHLIFK